MLMVGKRGRKRSPTPRSSRLRSGLSVIPSLFTIGNTFCGYFACIATLRGNYDQAAIAIGVGAVLDTLDGRIARMTKTTSDFGVELDSLADMLTFGVAPAMLAFSWGLGSSVSGIEANIAKHVNQFGWFATFAFVICGALRLARFNIHSKKPVDAATAGKRHFVGLPIPGAALMIAAIVHYFKSPILLIGSALLWYLLVLVISLLMISTFRYSSFKEFDLRKSLPRSAFVGASMMIAFIVFYSEIALMSLAIVYVSSGPVARLVQIVRRFLAPHAAPSEPAHGNIKT
jgi:CDP-diacylglycerol--serine O-phosphatidyltransferase